MHACMARVESHRSNRAMEQIFNASVRHTDALLGLDRGRNCRSLTGVDCGAGTRTR